MENIGELFKNQRENLQLSVDDISKKLKIRPNIIEAIEEGNFTILPAIYLKSTIKEYAAFLKLEINIDEILPELATKDKFDQLADDSNKATLEKAAQPKRYEEIFTEKKIKKNFFNQTNFATYLLFTAIIITLIALIYLALFGLGIKNPSVSQIADTSKEKTVDSAANSEQPAFTDSVKFTLIAHDKIWLRVSNDGENNRQVVLNSGEEMAVNAWEYITITCDKANAVSIKRGNEYLPPLSSNGTVIRDVKITRDDIINPTSVFSRPPDSVKTAKAHKTKVAKAPKKKKEKKENSSNESLPYRLNSAPITPHTQTSN